MIILDTCVVSETQKAEPNSGVIEYLNGCDPTTTYLTAITILAIQTAIGSISPSKLKADLGNSTYELFNYAFKRRILSLDHDAAVLQAKILAEALTDGINVGQADAMVAAIALSNNADFVVTRNAEVFEFAGVPAINPWIN